jgi:hypothetical protein
MDLNAVLRLACDAGASDLHLVGSKLTISGTVFIEGNVQITTGFGASTDAITMDAAQFQGGLYGQTTININQFSVVQGPMVSPATIKPGQSGSSRYPPSEKLAAGYPLDSYTIGPLYGHTG